MTLGNPRRGTREDRRRPRRQPGWIGRENEQLVHSRALRAESACDAVAVASFRRSGAILCVLATANFVAYAARTGLVTVYPDLRDKFGFRDAKLGLLMTAFIVPHAIATLVFGWAGDRFDRRRVIGVGLMIGSIAGACGALATSATTLILSRIVLGFGTAAVVPVANSILGQIYEGASKASRMALFNLGLLAGGVAGFAVGLEVGFPSVVVVLAIPGAIVSTIVALLPVPPHPGSATKRAPLGLRALLESGRRVIRIRALRWLMVATTAMAFAAGGYAVWFIDFLERDKAMTKGAATMLVMAAFGGAVAGIVTGARFADRMRMRIATGRLWVIALGMVATVPCLVLCLQLAAGPGLFVVGVATLFFMSWYHAPVAVSVDDLAPPAHAAAAQGMVIASMHLFGTAPSAWLLGVISDHYSLYTAMCVPMVAIAVAIFAIVQATRSFARDAQLAKAN